ncbi:hypothetical protein, partial [Ancylobacter sp. G4_0304]|uniref:hypothetical protein n=1 Tax=Ancylobacter sp. G4_0304 TaxID=3114289 RepID=UPI0039C67193
QAHHHVGHRWFLGRVGSRNSDHTGVPSMATFSSATPPYGTRSSLVALELVGQLNKRNLNHIRVRSFALVGAPFRYKLRTPFAVAPTLDAAASVRCRSDLFPISRISNSLTTAMR